MIKKEFEQKIPKIKKIDINHLNRQIPPKAHTPMYNFHKYWSRKTWNVVGEFIETYCSENGIVFDPFGGSGVTAIEALKRGRRVIISDISPLATELTRLTILTVNEVKLVKAFRRVEKKVKNRILDLYKTKCRKCNKEIVFDCAIWIKDKCLDIRYKKCPFCGDERRKDTEPIKYDQKLLKKINNQKIQDWYPTNKLYYTNGKPFMKKEHFESIDELFTKRNLLACSMLLLAIEEEQDNTIQDFLKIGFTSIVHLCTKMNPISEAGHFTPFSSAWTQHSYWYPSGPYMEQNVWLKYLSSIFGHQGLLKAKQDSNKYFKDVKIARNFKQIFEDKADVFIYTGSCLDIMKNMEDEFGTKGCIDYIFTDPPYDSSIQYGELTYLWVSWLKMDEGYLEKIASYEIIHNKRQNKDFEVYHSLLKNSFEKMFNVLKPDKYLTVTFHNPTFKVRNATIRAGVLSGFELQKIHHQELARPSAKSLLQPFGSAQGDLYLRFYKPDFGEKGLEPEIIDKIRFEKIAIDTTTRIIAERGEPTPYSLIINAIDSELAKRGFFAELNSGLDVISILKNHLNKEFILVDAYVGSKKGKLWWFKDPNLVPHLEKIPLSDRVEQTVLRQLQKKGRVTFTDIWEAVSIAFPNSLTSDQTSIKEALEVYSNKIQKGFWLLKSNFTLKTVEREHTTIIALLAEIGTEAGHQIHIGKIEQSHDLTATLVKKSGKLKRYVNYKNVFTLNEISNFEAVGGIDLLWIKDNSIKYIFEVECTTSMTSALNRGSNIPQSVKKVMLIPVDRENQFHKKMKSPMFNENFKNGNWSIILFDVLYHHWYKDKKNINIEELFNLPTTINTKKNKKRDHQLNLYGSE